MTYLGAAQGIQKMAGVLDPVFRFFTASAYTRRPADPEACDFAVGNPQEMALTGLVEAFQKWSQPQNPHWFGYKDNETASRALVAEALRQWRGVAFEPADIFMTNGAFAALGVALKTLVDPGDEVIFISPPWFFYEAYILTAGGVPVRVKVDAQTFDLDVAAIAAAITPRTRAIIINSPHNPTGRIYPAATLERLARVLTDASTQHGRPIYLLSDEAYSRIVYDGRPYLSPTTFYPYSFLLYTYGKTLLAPGQRMGYIALPPQLPERATLRPLLFLAQIALGYAFPNALLQHALSDLEKLSVDVGRLQQRRDRLVSALRAAGYEVGVPEGTFYLLPRAPMADDWAFVERLAAQHVYCLPGTVVEMPGYFRISFTASDDMVERALPIFAAARAAAG